MLSRSATAQIERMTLFIAVVVVIALAGSADADNIHRRVDEEDSPDRPLAVIYPERAVVECWEGIDPSHTGFPAVGGGKPPYNVQYTDDVSISAHPWKISIQRTWMVSDAAGNRRQSIQTIAVEDTTAPVIICPPDLAFNCEDAGDFGTPQVTDDCDPSPDLALEEEYEFYLCPWEYVLLRTWTATDEAGNSSSCTQRVRSRDIVSPTITYCPQDTTVGSGVDIGSLPHATAEDNCNPEPYMRYEAAVVDDGSADEFRVVRAWEFSDLCGNEVACEQVVTVRRQPPEPTVCTFTIGGWGSLCPTTQQNDSTSTQPGCIRDHYFDSLFPDGVMIGDTLGPEAHGAVWTTPEVVAAYLPDGATPGVLMFDHTDRVSTPAGVLGSQILALRLNREYSCAGIFATLGLSPDTTCYGEFTIPDTCGSFSGMTVDEFLVLADQVVSGQTALLDPYDADLSDMSTTAACLNELFTECEPDTQTQSQTDEACTTEDSSAESRHIAARDVRAPAEITLRSHPNPLSTATEISYGLPAAGRVLIEVFDIQGKKVRTLVDEYRPAGLHSTTWNADDRLGHPVAAGVYFCRLRLGHRGGVLEKLIKL
jgi:hypothetical protein